MTPTERQTTMFGFEIRKVDTAQELDGAERFSLWAAVRLSQPGALLAYWGVEGGREYARTTPHARVGS
jgi:hypothetical protein